MLDHFLSPPPSKTMLDYFYLLYFAVLWKGRRDFIDFLLFLYFYHLFCAFVCQIWMTRKRWKKCAIYVIFLGCCFANFVKKLIEKQKKSCCTTIVVLKKMQKKILENRKKKKFFSIWLQLSSEFFC